MKILILSDFYPPVIGGLERHVQLLSDGLSKRGHMVTVCTTKIGGSSSLEEENGVKIERLNGIFQRIPLLFKDIGKKYHPPTQDWLITKKLKHIIEETKPDIVHVHGWILYSILPLKKKYDIPLVTTLHDYGFICPKKTLMKTTGRICNEPFTPKCIVCGLDQYNLLKSFLAYWCNKSNKNKLKNVDKFIAVSQYVEEIYSRFLGLNEEKIVVIPNFYEIEEDLESSKSGIFPEDFILFVGVLIPRKGVDLLIKAYNTIKTKTKLVIIGTEHPDYLYKSSGNVIVMKNLPHKTVMSACAACKFLVMPRISPEACPTIAMEAMNFKKAVIASDVGGLKEMVIDGITGILTTPGNIEELANAIRFLLSHPHEAKKMGEKGYDLVTTRFSLNSVLPKIEKLYKKLCNPNWRN